MDLRNLRPHAGRANGGRHALQDARAQSVKSARPWAFLKILRALSPASPGAGEKKASPTKNLNDLNLNLSDRRLRMTLDLARELIGTPRHLSQHPGGFVLTLDRLDELVPIEPAAMDDRQVIEWDKDDIDALKFMKVDVLGLGMLGCMRRAFDLLAQQQGHRSRSCPHPVRRPGHL